MSIEKYAEEVRNLVTHRYAGMTKKDEKYTDERDDYVPVFYCKYCGNYHTEGECPVEDFDMIPGIDDGSGFLF